MRRIAWRLLLLFTFAIPWEYSLNLGEPLGPIARVVGLVLLLAAVPAVLQAGRLRTPSAMQWLVLAFYLLICCSYFWSIAPGATLERIRGYFQETMIVWLVWEFAESPRDLRWLLRAYVAGACVLALLSLADFRSAEVITAEQIRFVAEGQDPNDVARFLDLAFPFGALLLTSERGAGWRGLAMGYFPLGCAAVLLTASRGGFLGLVIALAGCALLLTRSYPRTVAAGTLALPGLVFGIWFLGPRETFERLVTIPEQLRGGDLNQRLNIWHAGWHAFAQWPWIGSGAGSFVAAARTDAIDTAHNTALSLAVGGGLAAVFLVAGIAALAVRSTLSTRGPVRVALATALLLWAAIAAVDTLEENRTTWLLLGLIAVSGRLAAEQSDQLEDCFPSKPRPKRVIGFDSAFLASQAGAGPTGGTAL